MEALLLRKRAKKKPSILTMAIADLDVLKMAQRKCLIWSAKRKRVLLAKQREERAKLYNELSSEFSRFIAVINRLIQTYKIPFESGSGLMIELSMVHSLFRNIDAVLDSAKVAQGLAGDFVTDYEHFKSSRTLLAELQAYSDVLQEYHDGAMECEKTLSELKISGSLKNLKGCVSALDGYIKLNHLLLEPIHHMDEIHRIINSLVSNTDREHPDYSTLVRTVSCWDESLGEEDFLDKYRIIDLISRSHPDHHSELLDLSHYIHEYKVQRVTSGGALKPIVLLVTAYSFAIFDPTKPLRLKSITPLNTTWLRILPDTRKLAHVFQLVATTRTYVFAAPNREKCVELTELFADIIDDLVKETPSLKAKRGLLNVKEKKGLKGAFGLSVADYEPTHEKYIGPLDKSLRFEGEFLLATTPTVYEKELRKRVQTYEEVMALVMRRDPVLVLKCTGGEHMGKFFVVGASGAKVGRSASSKCTIVLLGTSQCANGDSGVSREHFMITPKQTDFVVVNLSDKNGTTVTPAQTKRSQTLRGIDERVLQTGDVVTVGARSAFLVVSMSFPGQKALYCAEEELSMEGFVDKRQAHYKKKHTPKPTPAPAAATVARSGGGADGENGAEDEDLEGTVVLDEQLAQDLFDDDNAAPVANHDDGEDDQNLRARPAAAHEEEMELSGSAGESDGGSKGDAEDEDKGPRPRAESKTRRTASQRTRSKTAVHSRNTAASPSPSSGPSLRQRSKTRHGASRRRTHNHTGSGGSIEAKIDEELERDPEPLPLPSPARVAPEDSYNRSLDDSLAAAGLDNYGGYSEYDSTPSSSYASYAAYENFQELPSIDKLQAPVPGSRPLTLYYQAVPKGPLSPFGIVHITAQTTLDEVRESIQETYMSGRKFHMFYELERVPTHYGPKNALKFMGNKVDLSLVIVPR